MKILLLAWNRKKRYNWGHELFRRDLAKYHEVLFHGRNYYCNKEILFPEIFKFHGRPQVILTHVEHRERYFPVGSITELGNTSDILKVHYCGDYGSKDWPLYNEHFERVKYNLIFVTDTQVLIDLKANKVSGKHYLLPLSVDTSTFFDQHFEKILDVSIPISLTEDCRKQLSSFVKQLNVKTPTPQWVAKEAYVQRINESKIIVTCNKVYGEVGFKYTEVLACGTLLMASKPKDFDKLGYKDGEHLILYDGLKNLEDKIHYFLKHDQEREDIAKNGMRFVQKHHSNKIRIKEFTEIVEKELRNR